MSPRIRNIFLLSGTLLVFAAFPSDQVRADNTFLWQGGDGNFNDPMK